MAVTRRSPTLSPIKRVRPLIIADGRVGLYTIACSLSGVGLGATPSDPDAVPVVESVPVAPPSALVDASSAGTGDLGTVTGAGCFSGAGLEGSIAVAAGA